MIPQQITRPEDDVIARIDALVDEQLAHPEHFHTAGDRRACPVCGGDWHGLPGDGPAHYEVNGHTGAEGYVQGTNGGLVGCPGAHAISAARIRWRYRLADPPGWYVRGSPRYWPACPCRLPCGACCQEGRVPIDQIPAAWLADPRFRCRPAPPPRPGILTYGDNPALPPPMQFPRDGSREYGPRALAALRRILANMSQALAPIIGAPDLTGWGIEAGPVTEDDDHLEASFTLHPPGLADGPIIRFWDADMHELRGPFLPDGTLDDAALEGFTEIGTLADDGPQMAWERGGIVYVDQVRSVTLRPGGSGQGGGYTLADIETLRNEIWARAPHPGLRCYQCRRHLEPEHALLGTGPNTYWCLECADNYTQAHLRELQR